MKPKRRASNNASCRSESCQNPSHDDLDRDLWWCYNHGVAKAAPKWSARKTTSGISHYEYYLVVHDGIGQRLDETLDRLMRRARVSREQKPARMATSSISLYAVGDLQRARVGTEAADRPPEKGFPQGPSALQWSPSPLINWRTGTGRGGCRGDPARYGARKGEPHWRYCGLIYAAVLFQRTVRLGCADGQLGHRLAEHRDDARQRTTSGESAAMPLSLVWIGHRRRWALMASEQRSTTAGGDWQSREWILGATKHDRSLDIEPISLARERSRGLQTGPSALQTTTVRGSNTTAVCDLPPAWLEPTALRCAHARARVSGSLSDSRTDAQSGSDTDVWKQRLKKLGATTGGDETSHTVASPSASLASPRIVHLATRVCFGAKVPLQQRSWAQQRANIHTATTADVYPRHCEAACRDSRPDRN
ncbi:hypothetical protein TgHK011_005556 [Trichoderma gracile]|nr:hypothetical protein TgHK011_005556 [Trichoderma gracile]